MTLVAPTNPAKISFRIIRLSNQATGTSREMETRGDATTRGRQGKTVPQKVIPYKEYILYRVIIKKIHINNIKDTFF